MTLKLQEGEVVAFMLHMVGLHCVAHESYRALRVEGTSQGFQNKSITGTIKHLCENCCFLPTPGLLICCMTPQASDKEVRS